MLRSGPTAVGLKRERKKESEKDGQPVGNR